MTDPIYDASARAEASALFAQLKAILEPDTADGEEDLDDARFDLLTQIQEWAIGQNYPGSRRTSAYLVTLQHTLRDQAADDMLRLLCRIRGVTSVVPVEDDYQQRIGGERVRAELADKLFALGREVMK